jgi:hypothetical protein
MPGTHGEERFVADTQEKEDSTGDAVSHDVTRGLHRAIPS